MPRLGQGLSFGSHHMPIQVLASGDSTDFQRIPWTSSGLYTEPRGMRSTQDTASKYSQGIQTNLVAEWQEEPLRSEDFSRTGTLVHVLEAIELVRSADYHLCMCRTNGTECDGITEVKNRKKHLKEKHPDILSEYPGKDDQDPYCRSPTMSDVIRKATSFGCAFFQRHPEPQPQLTLNDVHSIYVYTLETEIYGSMNRCLREGDTVELAKWGPVIYHVQQALAKIPELSSGWSQLYRGIDLKVEGYLEGSIFPWPSFSSSSLKLDVVLSFAGTECGSIFMIRPLAKNSRGRPIADLSEFPSEMEVLFPPNSVFSVQQQLGIGAKDLLSRVLKLKDPGLTHVDVYELHELPLDWTAVRRLTLQCKRWRKPFITLSIFMLGILVFLISFVIYYNSTYKGTLRESVCTELRARAFVLDTKLHGVYRWGSDDKNGTQCFVSYSGGACSSSGDCYVHLSCRQCHTYTRLLHAPSEPSPIVADKQRNRCQPLGLGYGSISCDTTGCPFRLSCTYDAMFSVETARMEANKTAESIAGQCQAGPAERAGCSRTTSPSAGLDCNYTFACCRHYSIDLLSNLTGDPACEVQHHNDTVAYITCGEPIWGGGWECWLWDNKETAYVLVAVFGILIAVLVRIVILHFSAHSAVRSLLSAQQGQ